MWNRAAFDEIEVLNMKTLDAPTIEAPRDIPCAHWALLPNQNEPHTHMPVFYYINGDLWRAKKIINTPYKESLFGTSLKVTRCGWSCTESNRATDVTCVFNVKNSRTYLEWKSRWQMESNEITQLRKMRITYCLNMKQRLMFYMVLLCLWLCIHTRQAEKHAWPRLE